MVGAIQSEMSTHKRERGKKTGSRSKNGLVKISWTSKGNLAKNEKGDGTKIASKRVWLPQHQHYKTLLYGQSVASIKIT